MFDLAVPCSLYSSIALYVSPKHFKIKFGIDIAKLLLAWSIPVKSGGCCADFVPLVIAF